MSRKALVLFCLLVCSVFGEELFPWRQGVETVRVAFYRESGLMKSQGGDRRSGTSVEWMLQIAQKCNWEVQWVDTTFREAVKKLRRGEIDLLPAISLSLAEREGVLVSHSITGLYRAYAFVPQDSKLDVGAPLDSFAGLTVGYVDGYSVAEEFMELMRVGGVTCNYKAFNALKDLEVAFAEKKVDVALTTVTKGFSDARPVLAMPVIPTFFAVSSRRPDLLRKIDLAAASVLDEKPFFLQALRQRNYPSSFEGMASFSAEERVWLDRFKQQKMHIGVELYPLVSPFKKYNGSDKTLEGVLGVVLHEIATTTGLSFRFFNPNVSQEERQKRIDRGDVQIWLSYGCDETKEAELLNEFTLLQELRIPQVVCHLRNMKAYQPLSTGVVAVCENDTKRISSLTQEENNVKILLCDSLEDCLRAVKSGKALYTVGDYHSIRNACINMGLTSKMEIHEWNETTLYEPTIPILLHLNADPMLGNILRKSLAGFTDEYLEQIMTRVTMEEIPPNFISKAMLLNYLIFIFVVVLLLIIYLTWRGKRKLVQALEETDRARQATENALQEARMTAKFKTNFLATMSHEIRTPLNAVIGFADFLDKPDINPEQQREYARSIGFVAKALLSLINDILDLSKLESGNAEDVDLRQGKTDMKKLFDEMATIFSLKASEKGLTLEFDLEPNLPVLFLFEPRMRQILLNLIGNAVKFTEKGGVTVVCNSFNHTVDGFLDLELQVRDTGIGISRNGLMKIFDPFAQDIESRQGKVYSGTGLGLAIVKRLVDIARGTITAKSVLGNGSVFTIRLQHLAICPEENHTGLTQKLPTPVQNAPRHDVVFVDDIAMNRKILSLYLNSIGIHSQHEFSSAKEALAYLKDHQTDIILTDMWMPEMNGAEFAKEVRKLYPNLPVYSITPDADQKDSFDATAFTGILTKPVTAPMLKKLFEQGG